MLLLVMIAVYAGGLSWLSLERHAAHDSNALDLGYYSNTLWNTLHGQPFRFTTYHQANFVFPEFDPNVARKQDDLLAYHVEPILLPLSLLYALWADPRILLIVQSLVLASGAWPAFRIARRHHFPPWVALVFPLVYLLSPSLVSANLSDFHPVAFSAALFLWAFDAMERGSYKTYFIWVGLCLMLKEEMGLEVAMLGLWVVGVGIFTPSQPPPLRRVRLQGRSTPSQLHPLRSAPQQGRSEGRTHRAMRLRAEVQRWAGSPAVRVGLVTMVVAAGWTLAAVLIQRDAAGRQLSMFASRYAWLGHSPRELVVNALTTRSIFDWLRQPEAYGYLGFLLAQSGFAALLAPEVLLMAVPEVLINLFSSFDWMHSGLAHYSAPIVPFLVVGAIVGSERLGGWLDRLARRSGAAPGARADAAGLGQVHGAAGTGLRPRHGAASAGLRPMHGAAIVALIVLAGAAYQAYRAEQIPLPGRPPAWTVTAHDGRLAAVTALIPAGASVSAQSDLYPHVPERANLYLFPTISDADYILVDVTGQTYPIQPVEYAATIRQLLYESPAGLLAADDGYLLMARSEGQQTQLPDAFFSFARAGSRTPQHRLSVRFGQDLEMVGYDIELVAPRAVPAPAENVRTYWRALRPLTEDLRFVHRINARDGSLQNAEYGSPTEEWYPTSRWGAGEVIVVEQRGLQVPRGSTVGIRVEYGDPAAPVVVQPAAAEGASIAGGVITLPE